MFAYHCVILTAWGGHPSIVNPYLARSGTKKTDKLDARGLSLADLTGVWEPSYIPSIDVIELRMLVDERKQFLPFQMVGLGSAVLYSQAGGNT